MNKKLCIIISAMVDKKEIEFLRGKSSFNYTYDENMLELLKKNFALKDSLYLLAKKDGGFVGFCSIDRDWWEENFFFLREILVDPNFQKLSMGEGLMKQCIKHAKEKGATGVITETAFDNIPMQKLCEKVGFKKWDNPEWKEGITYRMIF